MMGRIVKRETQLQPIKEEKPPSPSRKENPRSPPSPTGKEKPRSQPSPPGKEKSPSPPGEDKPRSPPSPPDKEKAPSPVSKEKVRSPPSPSGKEKPPSPPGKDKPRSPPSSSGKEKPPSPPSPVSKEKPPSPPGKEKPPSPVSKEKVRSPSGKEQGNQTPAQLFKPKPRTTKPTATIPKPSPLPTGKVKKPSKPNEKEVGYSTPMRELSGTQIKNLLNHGGKSPGISHTQYEYPVDGSPSRGQAKSSAVIRAQEVRTKLDPQCPSFVKSLLRAHVASCFWMGLPSLFCKSHLPDRDITMTLEDETGKQYPSKYLACKTGLSAGWRQFSASHNLIEGDVLVFQLVGPTKFKVFIIRSSNLAELDGALGHLNLESGTKQKDPDKDNAEMSTTACNDLNRKRAHSPPLEVQKKKKTGLQQPAEQSENESEEVDSEVSEEPKFFVAPVQFEDVQSFDNFKILVNGLLVDSKLPDDVRRKYYNLCCTQNAFLHETVIKGMNQNLIVGAISQTVNIADAIKSSKASTAQEDFLAWDKHLLAFELLGMNVGFLRDRLCRLANLAYDSEGAVEAMMYKEARVERSQATIGIKTIEAKLEELRDACDEFGATIYNMRSKAELYKLKFHEELNAPW